MHLYRGLLLIFVSGIVLLHSISAPRPVNAQQGQRLVESVDITGNRRLREDDILYYVQTEEGARGGVNVIFEVKELPIIRDLQFEGLKSVPESDVLKAFRERRVGVSKESIYDPVKVNGAMRVLKELLAAHGHPNATVEKKLDEVSATSTALTFVIDEGKRVRVVEIQFEGNKIFSDGKLRGAMKLVKEAGLMTRFKGQDILDREKLEFDLRHVDNYMRSKGYLQARHGEPRVESVG